MHETYTSRFLLTGYVGLILCNAVPSWLLQVVVPLRVLLGYYSAATACTVVSEPFVRVASEYPQWYCNLSCHSGIAQYETYVASRRNLDVYVYAYVHKYI